MSGAFDALLDDVVRAVGERARVRGCARLSKTCKRMRDVFNVEMALARSLRHSCHLRTTSAAHEMLLDMLLAAADSCASLVQSTSLPPAALKLTRGGTFRWLLPGAYDRCGQNGQGGGCDVFIEGASGLSVSVKPNGCDIRGPRSPVQFMVGGPPDPSPCAVGAEALPQDRVSVWMADRIAPGQSNAGFGLGLRGFCERDYQAPPEFLLRFADRDASEAHHSAQETDPTACPCCGSADFSEEEVDIWSCLCVVCCRRCHFACAYPEAETEVAAGRRDVEEYECPCCTPCKEFIAETHRTSMSILWCGDGGMMRLGRWVKWKDGPSPPAAVFDDYVDDEAESGYWDRAESEDHMQWNSGGLTGPV